MWWRCNYSLYDEDATIRYMIRMQLFVIWSRCNYSLYDQDTTIRCMIRTQLFLIWSRRNYSLCDQDTTIHYMIKMQLFASIINIWTVILSWYSCLLYDQDSTISYTMKMQLFVISLLQKNNVTIAKILIIHNNRLKFSRCEKWLYQGKFNNDTTTSEFV